ncbi:hypothetical protein FIBSPDRAFT_905426 [Athelia psychrophila]|uniref:Uncharacterized protein n=1 Tax=Athelia psychrophila TaxID=1759441 RepID=A0A167TGA6_9AGAM|nr:hypothetical protein FIBSPDRAFT_905426 [Fibularhizoctonia sp. CBS 109695]
MSSHSSSNGSQSSSPIHSVRLIVASESAKPSRKPFPNFESSDPYHWSPGMYWHSDDSMMGNQLAYFEKHGYPSLPKTAGQQYISPEGSSPCVGAARRRSSFEENSVTVPRKRTRSRGPTESDSEPPSSEHAQTRASKRLRLNFSSSSEAPQKARAAREMRSFLDKLLRLDSDEDVSEPLAEHGDATELEAPRAKTSRLERREAWRSSRGESA